MASKSTKKRSFGTFESDQKNVEHSSNKKTKHNTDFFQIKFFEPAEFDHEKSFCLEFRNLLSIIQENTLYGVIRGELQKWYLSKKEKKENGAIDIHLFHNRHNGGLTGFGYIYFENKSDASYILQLSKQKLLKCKRKFITCQWREINTKDRDSYSSIFQTDISLKSETDLIKISNLQWKTSILHLKNMFVKELGAEYSPLWLKILEDKNGFAKNCALVQLDSAENVVYAIDKLLGTYLLGRKLRFEYSAYKKNENNYENEDEHKNNLSGITTKLLLTNIKQSVKVNDVKKFLVCNGIDLEMIVDIYLIHNLNKVCSGKCFLSFDNAANTEKCMELLQFKQLCNRTVLVEYGHLHTYERGTNINYNLEGKTNRLFVSNLAWDVKEKDIIRFFGEKLSVDRENIHFNISPDGFPKGSAFITFKSKRFASNAFRQSKKKKLRNRIVKLDFAKMYDYDQQNNNENPYI